MKHINLLPWRQKQREEQSQLLNGWMAFSLLMGVGIGVIFFLYARNLMTEVETSIAELNREVEVCNVKILQIAKYKGLKKALMDRMQVVQNLQSTRALTVHLFDELIKIIPEGMYLIQLKRMGNEVTILGSADSNTSVSMLMTNIAQNAWITNPQLKEIKKPTEEKKEDVIKFSPSANEFELTFNVQPKTEHPKNGTQ